MAKFSNRYSENYKGPIEKFTAKRKNLLPQSGLKFQNENFERKRNRRHYSALVSNNHLTAIIPPYTQGAPKTDDHFLLKCPLSARHGNTARLRSYSRKSSSTIQALNDRQGVFHALHLIWCSKRFSDFPHRTGLYYERLSILDHQFSQPSLDAMKGMINPFGNTARSSPSVVYLLPHQVKQVLPRHTVDSVV